MSIEANILSDTRDIKSAPVGRPRLLASEDILDAAIELGLESITMKRLATHLNVGAATLYQYFESRDALLRAAAVRALGDLAMPVDIGQHWSLYALEYAEMMQSLLANNPYYIQNYQQNDYGFEVQFQIAEQFLSVLSNKGFASEKAMQLFNSVAMAAVAGAIEMARENAFVNQSMGKAAAEQLNNLAPETVPLVRKSFHVYTETASQKLRSLLAPVFQTVARERGEPEHEIVIEV